ncbi:Uncharacterized protein APZ42_025339 [Daphnia magna]|uniref:Uncharacterized protein n=1 Tax=Daphnia magna TaxID=35525 RepID=A0A164T6I8_9CRUS|nr:Uncharacterized protein APZ42_025339 [Daphnia magna]
MTNPFSDVMDLFEDESVPVLSEVPFDAAWTREHNTAENREKHSWYNTILKEAAVSDHYTFITATRMTPTIFEGLLQRIAQVGHKQDTTFRKCIPLGARLDMSLCYFTTLACTSPFL